MTNGFMLIYKELPRLQMVVHSIPSFPLLRGSSTLSYFLMVWHGLPPHPMKPKRVEFGQLRLGGSLKRSARAVQLFGRLAVLETHTL